MDNKSKAVDTEIEAPKQKVIPITLDRLEAGTDDHEGFTSKFSKKLPEGVTNKMIYSDIIRIGWPALLELLLIQLTGMFDQIQVGKIGAVALAAVGLANVPKFLLNTAVMALNVGVTAMVARARGRKDREQAQKMMHQGYLMTFIVSIIITIGGYYASELMIKMMGAPDAETLRAGTEYMEIICLGTLPVAMTMTTSAALRAVGNSRISLYYNLISNLVNIFLNWVLINGIKIFGIQFPRMEIRGAALATIIGQTVAFVIAFIVITRPKSYLCVYFNKGYFKPDNAAMSDIIKIGVPACVEQLIMRVGMILYTRIIASLGTELYATHTICMNILSLSFMLGQGIAVSSTSLVGQSLGKKRPDMAEAYSKRSQTLGFYCATVIALMFAFFGKGLVGLYTTEADMIALGGKILLFVAVMQPFQASQFILAGSMRGAGDTKVVAIITSVTTLLLRPFLAYAAVNWLNLSLEGAWYATIIDQLVRTIFIYIRYNSGKWKNSFRSRSEVAAQE